VTPGARVAATIELLDEIVSQSDRPADLVANAFFRARRFIGGGDRRAVADRVWGILRRYGQLSWWVDRTRADRSARAIVAAELLLVEGLPLGDMQALFDGGRYRPSPLEEAETRALRQMEGHSLSHPEQPDWVRLNVQEWTAPHLREAYGDAWGREIAALETPAPVDLRVNRLKATIEDARRALHREGIETEPMRYAPHGLRLKRRLSVVAGEAFDRVLVDAPCTGSGVLRRNPEARWRLRPEDLVELPRIQRDLLARAAQTVRPGGRLIYATCSVMRAENDAVVDAFLSEHPQFEFVLLKEILGMERALAIGDGARVRTAPDVQGTDGFFAAVMRHR